jgi:hypothetical protein
MAEGNEVKLVPLYVEFVENSVVTLYVWLFVVK